MRVPKGALMTTESLMMADQALSASVKEHPLLSSTQVPFFFLVLLYILLFSLIIAVSWFTILIVNGNMD